MIENRLKELRHERILTLEELGNLVGTTATTVQRYENNRIKKKNPDLMAKFAEALDTSVAYLLGLTDDLDSDADLNYEVDDLVAGLYYEYILVLDDDMSPEIPKGSIVEIRPVETNEPLQIGSFYYIEFSNTKGFRMVIEDEMDGVGFLPHDVNERRIAYDLDYVNIVGKAVSMKVYFDDDVKYD